MSSSPTTHPPETGSQTSGKLASPDRRSLLFPLPTHSSLFGKGMRLSASAHAILLGFLLFASFLLPSDQMRFAPSIKVDLVALPDIKKSDISPMPKDDLAEISKKLSEAEKSAQKLNEKAEAQRAKEMEQAPDDTMAFKKEKAKAKKDLKSAIDRIKALAEVENDVKHKSASARARELVKGNVASDKSSVGDNPEGATNSYISHVQGKLAGNWNLPVWLSSQKLNAKIVIFLDKSGYVSNMVLAQSSGNQQFDDYCSKTIRMSQPFGAPPSELLNEGLTLGFPL